MTTPTATTATNTGSISGAVLCGGKGVAGVLLYLDADNHVQQRPTDVTTTTNAAGQYTFAGVAAGTPIVRAVTPAGYAQTVPATPKGDYTYGIHTTLKAGQILTGQNFAYAMVATPAVQVAPSYPAAWAIPAGKPVYYVSNAGSDANDGKTPATAWRTPKTVAGAVTLLAAGETFDVTAQIAMAEGSWLGGDPTQPLPTITTAVNGLWLFGWAKTIQTWTQANLNITSSVPIAANSVNVGNAYGVSPTIANVHLTNLNEGYDASFNGTLTMDRCTGLCRGRTVYVESQCTLAISNCTFGTGEAATQDPWRMETGSGTLTNVVFDQSQSSFGTAGFAGHGASNLTLINCGAIRGPFSFDTEGSEVGAGQVNGCKINGLWVLDSTINVGGTGKLTTNTTFTAPYVENASGTCVSLEGEGDGNVIDGGVFVSDNSHAIMFYSASSMIVKNCTLYTSNKGAVLMAGSNTAANDGGGNKVVIVPKPAQAPASVIPAAAAAAKAALTIAAAY